MSNLAKRITSIITALCFIAVALVVYIQTQQKGDEYQVTAYFDKGIGLFENSDVTILGVAVGKVSHVEPAGSRVKVEMNIKSEHKLPADATAEIVPISVISDRYVEFAPVYESGPVLQDGSTLDVDRTNIPAELDDVFKQLKKLLDALAPGKEGELGSLGEMIVALDKALSGREQDLKGTIVNSAQLTRTLARARGDISNLLINLDELFGKLAPHAGDFATLNKNFAIVMQYLSDSRQDIEGTLTNLAEMTGEVGDFVRDNRAQVAALLERAAKVTPVVLRNRKSIQQSMAWLPVVGAGLRNAYHPPPINATDVRSNQAQASFCNDFGELFPIDDLPENPLGDALEEALKELEEEFCATPGGGGGGGVSVPGGASTPDTREAPTPDSLIPDLRAECKKALKKVKKQLERIEEIDVPQELKTEIVDPLEDRVKKLRKRCNQLGDAIEDPSTLEDLFKQLPDDVEDLLPDDEKKAPTDLDGLEGNAAGATAAGTPGPSVAERIGSWWNGFMNFVGVSP